MPPFSTPPELTTRIKKLGERNCAKKKLGFLRTLENRKRIEKISFTLLYSPNLRIVFSSQKAPNRRKPFFRRVTIIRI